MALFTLNNLAFNNKFFWKKILFSNCSFKDILILKYNKWSEEDLTVFK